MLAFYNPCYGCGECYRCLNPATWWEILLTMSPILIWLLLFFWAAIKDCSRDVGLYREPAKTKPVATPGSKIDAFCSAVGTCDGCLVLDCGDPGSDPQIGRASCRERV